MQENETLTKPDTIPHPDEAESLLSSVTDTINETDIDGDPTEYNKHISEAIRYLQDAYLPEINNYHFSMGDSTDGPIGLAARITGSTKERAVKRLQRILNDITGRDFEIKLDHEELASDEYISVYITSKNIALDYIDEFTQVG